MKKQSIYLFFLLLFTACQQDLSPEMIVKQIKGIHLTEAPLTRTMRVSAQYESKTKENLFQNMPLQPLPVSRESSNIIITDTIGFIVGEDGNTITPSTGGVNVIIDVNIQPGEYYCQTYENGRMTCERGTMGTHLRENQLTTLATYPTSNHFASAAYRNEIIIFQEYPSGNVSEAMSYPTSGRTICVYHKNGNLVVALRT